MTQTITSQALQHTDRDASRAAVAVDEPATASEAPHAARSIHRDRPLRYLFVSSVLILAGLAAIWRANVAFAPEMYDPKGSVAIAEVLSRGNNFATFDLNINIREIRDAQFARMSRTPEIAILGASHWQEAHSGVLPQKDFFNAHVHRDYVEDMIGVVEMMVRHDRLPKQLIIAVRDILFMSVADRSDYLWLPIVPYYEAGAKRLGLKPHAFWKTAPYRRWRELASVQMLHTNVVRWYDADVKPHESQAFAHDTLDLVLPDGSILWSQHHKAIFTRERARQMSETFAAVNADKQPPVDPVALAQFERLLAFLKEKGVDLYFVHPPFNPIYWEKVQGTRYLDGLRRIEKLTADLATKYDALTFGSFDPGPLGCTSQMYIDAEHANPECLGKLFAGFTRIDRNPSMNRTAPADGSDARDKIASATGVRAAAPAPIALAAMPVRRPAPARNAPTVINAGIAAARDADDDGEAARDMAAANLRLEPRAARSAVVVETAASAVSASRLHMPDVAARTSADPGRAARGK